MINVILSLITCPASLCRPTEPNPALAHSKRKGIPMKYMPQETIGDGHVGYQQQVKEANIKQIFDLVRSGKCKSRAEIVRAMNLSATSVSVLVEELANRKLIEEVGPTQTSLPGRRPISLKLNANARNLAVFLVRPDGVRYTLLNLGLQILEDFFVPLDTHRLNVNTAGDEYLQLFDDVMRRRSKLFSPSRVVALGICFPGIYIGRDHLFHSERTMGFSLPEESMQAFQRRIGRPVFLLNRTRSMAYAEKKYLDALDPEAPETQNLLFVRIEEDDMRASIITSNELFTGPFNVAGEIGHYTIDYKGKPCRCGNRGCLEGYVKLSAILERARQAARAAGIEEPQSFEELARRYADDPALLASVKESAELLAFGLYDLLCSSGMRHLVLGGDITALGKPFLEELYHNLMKRTLLIRTLNLNYAQAGPDAEVLGIAHYFLDKVFTVTM